MKRQQLKSILFGAIVTVALLLVLAFDARSLISWHLGTIRSELWAASQPKNNDSVLKPEAINLQESKAAIFPNSRSRQTDNTTRKSDFPLGWYNSIDYPDTLQQIAAEEINFVVPYTGKSDAVKVMAFLDRALEAGIKVLVEIPRLEVRRDHRWLITQFVRKLKNHPAVSGWYLYDEPEYVKLSPRLLERVYGAIKTEDPEHTIAIAFGNLTHVHKYLKALDTVIYFNYPCYSDSSEFCNLDDGRFGKLTTEAGNIARRKDNFWVALQGYGEDKNGKPRNNRRLPSLEEERYMIYSSILAQANGLLFWAHYLSQQQWIDDVLTPLVRELKEYLPAITNQATVPKASVKQATVQARLFRNPQNNSLFLIAVNHSPNRVSTEIAFQPRIKVDSIEVLQENRAIALQQGALTDRFEPFAVHVYQLQSD